MSIFSVNGHSNVSYQACFEATPSYIAIKLEICRNVLHIYPIYRLSGLILNYLDPPFCTNLNIGIAISAGSWFVLEPLRGIIIRALMCMRYNAHKCISSNYTVTDIGWYVKSEHYCEYFHNDITSNSHCFSIRPLGGWHPYKSKLSELYKV